ncbi:MAG: hypothetical protein AAGA81_16595, partial [Acidobacteriota bacterium]
FSQSLPREVISRRPESSGHQNEIAVGDEPPELGDEQCVIVGNDGLARQFASCGQEGLSQTKRVRIDAIRSEKLGTDRQDAGVHWP